MNRVIGRAKVLLVLILVLSLGMTFFLGEYLIKARKWVQSAGSPHIYYAGNIGCGEIYDREGNLLLDLTGSHTYASDASLRASTMHWLGDRQGNISAPALSYYAMEIAGYDAFNGVYSVDGVGGEVQLSLSARLQTAALEAMKGYKGTLAIYNYETGEILCAVTTPTYDPEEVPDITGDNAASFEGVYLNRFTQSSYTPGSIYKIVTAAAALECIPDIESQHFTCTGSVEYGSDKVTCEKVHGEQSFKDAFKNSCNCAFAKIAGQIGGERLTQYAKQFGILDSMKFDGITTVSGNLEADKPGVSLAWSAIGQHKDLVNPASFLSFVSAVANGGLGQTPHLVNKISVDGRTTHEADGNDQERIMSGRTAQILQEFMRNNVENYYGDENFEGFTVCAKSGTAEVGGSKKPNAMFTGFIVDEGYPLAFMVVIEDGGYGRQVCVPVLQKVLAVCREISE